MKTQTFPIAIYLVLSIAVCSAQSDKEESDDVIIEAAYKQEITIYKPIKTLYKNADQVIKISCKYNSHITAKVDNGFIRDDGWGSFTVYPDSLGQLTIKVYDNTDTDNVKLVSAKVYKVIPFPARQTFFAGKTTGKITREEFLNDSIVHCNKDGATNGHKFKIVSFKISILIPGEDPILDIPSNGNRIPEQVRKIVRLSPVGTKIYFEYMKAQVYEESVINNEIVESTMDGSPRAMDPMSLIISY